MRLGPILAGIALLMPLAVARAQDMDSVTWHLRGIDIFGLHTISPGTLKASLPWKVGDIVRASDKPARERWCADVQLRFALLDAKCALILIQPDSAYLSVDVVEKADAWRIPHPKDRWDAKVVLNPTLKSKFRALDKRIDEKFVAGVRVHDVTKGLDHVDYEDPDLHLMALELARSTPPYRQHILDVLARGKDSSDRVAAAVLLNWAGDPEASAARIYQLLDDPDASVRNYISRFLIKWAPRIPSRQTKGRLIGTIASQLDRPSFGDRNKAVFVLRELADADASARPRIAAASCSKLRNIAALSSAPNVGGEARELLAELAPSAPRGVSCQQPSGA